MAAVAAAGAALGGVMAVVECPAAIFTFGMSLIMCAGSVAYMVPAGGLAWSAAATWNQECNGNFDFGKLLQLPQLHSPTGGPPPRRSAACTHFVRGARL
jgi:hypothetical protein